MQIDSVEKAKKVIEAHENDWPPMTENPYVNFLLDIAQQEMMQVSANLDPTLEVSDWEDVREEYEEEVSVYQRENVSLEPFDAEELAEKYLN